MVKSVEELKTLVSDYDVLLEKAGRLSDGYNFSAERLGISTDENGEIYVDVSGTETCCGCNDYETYSIPAKWLFMTDEEIEAERKLIREREAEAEEADDKDLKDDAYFNYLLNANN
jgi:hypothetical protein